MTDLFLWADKELKTPTLGEVYCLYKALSNKAKP